MTNAEFRIRNSDFRTGFDSAFRIPNSAFASSLLQFPDPVADSGRLLVRLLRDRLLEAAAELGEFLLVGLGPGQPAGGLAGVPDVPVDVLQQREQLLAEGVVVVRAAEPAGVAELDGLGAALAALLAGRL